MSDHDFVSLFQRVAALEKSILTLKIPPHADPPPDDLVNFRDKERLQSDLVLNRTNSIVLQRLEELVRMNPGWFTDPPPDDFLNVRVLDLIRRFGRIHRPRADTFEYSPEGSPHRIPGGGFTDPSPGDIGRLTLSALESHLHKLGGEIVRLRSLERLMQDRVQQMRGSKTAAR
jgi:hypothetical protein